MELNLPCDGKCEECQFSDCILTEEQALQLEIYENGTNYDIVEQFSLKPMSRELRYYYKHKKESSEYHKKYYQEHKEEIKQRVAEHKKNNREHYNAYNRNHPRKRDRKEYFRQYHLKRKELKNVEGKIVTANGDSGNIGTT